MAIRRARAARCVEARVGVLFPLRSERRREATRLVKQPAYGETPIMQVCLVVALRLAAASAVAELPLEDSDSVRVSNDPIAYNPRIGVGLRRSATGGTTEPATQARRNSAQSSLSPSGGTR